MKLTKILTLAALALVATGCSMSRTTTTGRTGIEMALLTQTAHEAVGGLEIPQLMGKTYELKPERLYGFGEDPNETNRNRTLDETRFLWSDLEEKLLKAGAKPFVGEDEKAQIIVEPRTHFNHLDDDKFLIGLPQIPIPIPGGSAVQTPEIVLFGMDTQKGRTRVSLYGKDTEANNLAFATTSESVEHRYRRYRIFFFFTWRATTLPAPF